jgi:hypothetical protein
MPNKNQGPLFILFIVVIIAIWYLTKGNDKPTLPLGLGQPLINKNISKFLSIKFRNPKFS